MRDAYKLIDLILKTLFVAEERRIAKALDKLHLSNVEVSREQLDGFMYNGKFYRWSQAAAGAGKRRTLHLALWPDMEKLLSDQKQIENDKQMIRQLLVRLYDACHCEQDIRDATPEVICDTLPANIASLERIKNPNFYIFTHGDLKLLGKMLPRMQLYSASRLIY